MTCFRFRWIDRRLTNRAPAHRYQNPAFHLFDERYGLVHRVAPSSFAPALLPGNLSLPQIGKLPQVMDRVQRSHLTEPGPNTFHDVFAGPYATAPVRFPFQQATGENGVGPKFKYSSKGTWRASRPEGELLHEIRTAGANGLCE